MSPVNNRALWFAGQGTQYPGMGEDLYKAHEECRQVFELASRIFGKDIARLCFHGKPDALGKTQHTQPAVLTVDLCAYMLAKKAGHSFQAAAGFSLGEYAALVAAGVTDMEGAFTMVKWRTDSMLETMNDRSYGMLAVMDMSLDQAEGLCRMIKEGDVFVSNHNSSRQLSLSGDLPGLSAFRKLAQDRGTVTVPLYVNRPFHCRLMEPAARDYAKKLQSMPLKSPSIPLYMNAVGRPVMHGEDLRELLVRQITAPVLWKETLEAMYTEGLRFFWECSPKSVCGRFLKETLGNRDYVYRFGLQSEGV